MTTSEVVVLILLAGAVAVWYAIFRGRLSGEPSAPRTQNDPYPDFTVGLRGYEIAAVDDLLARLHGILGDAAEGRPVDRATVKNLLATQLPIVLRGYDREQVDTYIERCGEFIKQSSAAGMGNLPEETP